MERLPELREGYKEYKHIIEVIDEMEKTFLYKGAIEYFTKLIPRESETVLAHNDA